MSTNDLETKDTVKHIFLASIFVALLGIHFGSFANEIQGPDDAADSARAEQISVFALGQAIKGRTDRGVTHSLTQAFIVEAKSSRVNLSCAVTNMQLEGSSGGKYSASDSTLKPDATRGCLIEVPNAVSTLGASSRRTAHFNRAESDHLQSTSDYVTFQSTDGASFKEDVFVTVYWQSMSDVQSSGEYTGKIQLTASTPDVLSPPR